MDILVYVIKAGTAYDEKRNVTKGLKLLKDHIKRFQKYHKSYKLNKKERYKGIIIAPEYYFTGYNKSGKREGISRIDRDTLVINLKQISGENQGIVIVPGSIYSQDAITHGVEKAKIFQSLLMKELNMKIKKQKISDYDYVKGQTSNLTGLFKNMGKLGKQKIIYPCYNQCLLFFDGKEHVYGKKRGYNEGKGKKMTKLFFAPSTGTGIYKIHGYKYGVEVCFDHANSILKTNLKGNSVDFHVVVSAWAMTETNNMGMGPGGYFIHASTNFNQCLVYANSGGKINKIQWKKETKSWCACILTVTKNDAWMEM